MKKQVILLALILISGFSVLRSQEPTLVKAADMSAIQSTGFEFRFVWGGGDVIVSVRALNPPSSPNDSTTSIAARMNFQNDTRFVFDTGGVKQPLKLQMVDEETAVVYELKVDKNGEFRLLTHELPHLYKLVLNGFVIGTGYKPPKYR